MPGNDGYLQLVGIMQKLSISRSLLTPTTIRHASRQESADAATAERPAHRLQIRGQNLYYQNTRDGAEDAQDDLVPSSRTMAAKAAHVRSDIEMPDGRERLIRHTARFVGLIRRASSHQAQDAA